MLSLQVFVFSRTAYSMIKERLKSKGVADITAKELEGYFSPWHAKHIGQIKVTVTRAYVLACYDYKPLY